jgi:hypothetical protein
LEKKQPLDRHPFIPDLETIPYSIKPVLVEARELNHLMKKYLLMVLVLKETLECGGKINTLQLSLIP